MDETISESVWIDAPPERVFELLNTPQECANSTPSQEWSNVEPAESGGYRYDYTFRMAGVPLTGTVEAVVCDKENLKIVNEYDGDLDATLILNVTPEEGGARFNWETRYALPENALSRIAAPILRSYNRREVKAAAKNIKQMLESGWMPPQEE